MTGPAPITPDQASHDAATALGGHAQGLEEAMTTLARMCAEAPVDQTKAAFTASVLHKLGQKVHYKSAQIAQLYSREGQGDG